MYAKDHIWYVMDLCWSTCSLPRHVLADVDRRIQQARIRAQRYRETHGDQRRAADASKRCLSYILERERFTAQITARM